MKKAIYILILFAFFKLLLKEAILKPISKRTITSGRMVDHKSESGLLVLLL
jgi:hypothetical protein